MREKVTIFQHIGPFVIGNDVLICLNQGLLRLDHCFVKPKNEDAEVIEVDVGGEKKKIVMAPGKKRLT